MKKSKILTILGKNKTILTIFIILIFTNAYIIFFLENIDKRSQPSEEYVCPIEYSKPICINSSYFISFYNPNEFELHKIQIIAEKPDGTDTISVDSPLPKNMTEILRLPECYVIENVEVRWCCADICYQNSLTAYSEDVTTTVS